MWSAGLSKGLTQYIPENYDNERLKMEEQAIKDKKLNKNSVVTDMNREIFKLDLEENDMIEERIEDEEYNMNNIPDDDEYESE
jgi:predicted  nucleic acid-binding Zn-ribbon protein